jgi:uncharacterized protein
MEQHRSGRRAAYPHTAHTARREANRSSGIACDALKIRLAAAPVEGAANAALVAFLAEVFGVPQRQVVLKQGSKSRRKVIEVIQAVRGPEVLFRQIHDGDTN